MVSFSTLRANGWYVQGGDIQTTVSVFKWNDLYLRTLNESESSIERMENLFSSLWKNGNFEWEDDISVRPRRLPLRICHCCGLGRSNSGINREICKGETQLEEDPEADMEEQNGTE